MGEAGPTQRFEMCGVPLDSLTLEGALARIATLVRGREGGYVVTPNIDHIVLVNKNQEFAQAYRSASVSLVDGTPVLWAARLLGHEVPEKVSGSDLIWPLFAMAAKEGFSVYLLGGGDGAAERAREVLQQRHPELNIAGIDAPWIDLQASPGSDDGVVERITSARPDLLIVGLGAPKQEIWIHRNRHRLGSTVCLGLGASIDFVAGRVQRAPQWVSRAGLEWLYRLAREPRRLASRYLVRDPQFVPLFLRELASRRGKNE